MRFGHRNRLAPRGPVRPERAKGRPKACLPGSLVPCWVRGDSARKRRPLRAGTRGRRPFREGRAAWRGVRTGGGWTGFRGSGGASSRATLRSPSRSCVARVVHRRRGLARLARSRSRATSSASARFASRGSPARRPRSCSSSSPVAAGDHLLAVDPDAVAGGAAPPPLDRLGRGPAPAAAGARGPRRRAAGRRARRARRALPRRRARRGLQARDARRRARPAGGHRARARATGSSGAPRSSRSSRARSRSLDRWAERGLDRRAPISRDPPRPGLRDDASGPATRASRSGSGRETSPEKLARLERVLAAVDAEGQRAEVLHLDNRRRPDWVAVRVARAKAMPENGGPVARGGRAAARPMVGCGARAGGGGGPRGP